MKRISVGNKTLDVFASIGEHFVQYTTRHKEFVRLGDEFILSQRYEEFRLTPEQYQQYKSPLPIKKASVEIYDNMLKVKVSGVQPPHLEGVKRGQVNLAFSGKKRKRFIDEFNKWRLPPENSTFMVTLTYPDLFPMDWRVWKEHLELFRAGIMNLYPDIEGFWRLELIDRKSGINRGLIAPHYHLILSMFTKVLPNDFRMACKTLWSEIAHSDDKYQGKNAVRVDIVTSPRHALNYAAKYCTKFSAEPISSDGEIITQEHIAGGVGRQWGKIGKPDCSASEIYTVSRASAAKLFDLCLKMKQEGLDSWKGLWRQDQNQTFTVYNFGDNPKMHEKYHRPAFPPAREMLRRAVKKAGLLGSVRKERLDWQAPITDDDCLWVGESGVERFGAD